MGSHIVELERQVRIYSDQMCHKKRARQTDLVPQGLCSPVFARPPSGLGNHWLHKSIRKMFSNTQPNWAEGLTALISLATLLAVLLAMIQIRHINRQMHRELEMQYLLRFWQLMDRQSAGWKTKGQLNRHDKAVVKDYLTLSEDQIQLRALGRVTDQTWSYWKQDIRAMCGTGPVGNILATSAPLQYAYLRNLLLSESYDPLTRNRLRRLWDGL
jgi:hypothetical protein